MSWLDELKVGDKVIVSRIHYRDSKKSLHVIDRITPSRQMVVSGYEHSKFKNGEKMGERSWGNYTILEEWSQEKQDTIVAANRRFRVSQHLSSFDYRTLTLEEREEVFSIVSRHGKVQGLPP